MPRPAGASCRVTRTTVESTPSRTSSPARGRGHADMAGMGQGASDARTSAKRASSPAAARASAGRAHEPHDKTADAHGKQHGKQTDAHGKHKTRGAHKAHGKHHKRRHRKHRRVHRHHAAHKHALGTVGVPLPVAPVSPPAPASTPVPAHEATLALGDAHRLLWRAGFGPVPGQAQALVGQSVQQVVYGLTRPSGEAGAQRARARRRTRRTARPRRRLGPGPLLVARPHDPHQPAARRAR